MSHFSDIEIEQLNSLQLDSAAQSFFDPMRYCLRWPDEEPSVFSGERYERFLDLVIVRSFIHRGKPKEEWYAISPTNYFVEVWDEALSRAPNWPGFQRITLNAADRALYNHELAKPFEAHL